MVRRVVTGESPEGRSRFTSNEETQEGVLWAGLCSDLMAEHVPGGLDVDLNGPRGGYAVRVISLPPDSVMKPLYATGSVPQHDERGFHRTNTLDVVIVIDGEVVAEMEDGQRVALAPGDCVIQRGTRHAWRNPGGTAARMAAVMFNTEN